jgi:hypothetical protein
MCWMMTGAASGLAIVVFTGTAYPETGWESPGTATLARWLPSRVYVRVREGRGVTAAVRRRLAPGWVAPGAEEGVAFSHSTLEEREG